MKLTCFDLKMATSEYFLPKETTFIAKCINLNFCIVHIYTLVKTNTFMYTEWNDKIVALEKMTWFHFPLMKTGFLFCCKPSASWPVVYRSQER